MSYTLVVVDMQEGFLKGFTDENVADDVVYFVQEAVTQAIRDDAEIIDLNYRGRYGPTIAKIRHLWRAYKKEFPGRVKKVIKPWDGGGQQVMDAEPIHEMLVVCGVNFGACVKDTVTELINDHGQDVRIISEAVANTWTARDDEDAFFEDILI